MRGAFVFIRCVGEAIIQGRAVFITSKHETAVLPSLPKLQYR